MISCEAERELRLLVAHDPNFGGFPLTTPGIDMCLHDGREATCADRGEMIRRRLRGTGNITRREDGDNAVQARGFAEACLPRPLLLTAARSALMTRSPRRSAARMRRRSQPQSWTRARAWSFGSAAYQCRVRAGEVGRSKMCMVREILPAVVSRPLPLPTGGVRAGLRGKRAGDRSIG